ncbi:MAG: cell division protein FtsQ/DivIB [Pseudomonadota bacterium]
MRPLARRGSRGEAARPACDPAPSRLAYRLERIWLRPWVRRIARVGLPLAALASAVAWYVSEPARVAAVTDRVAELRRAVEERPEFMVKLLAVDGASPELAQAVRDSVEVSFPISSFDLDLDALHADVSSIDAVAQARVRIKPGGVLQVEITERQPALVWRRWDGLILVDETGHPIAATERRADWPELPLIAGEGANDAAEEAVRLYAAAEPLKDRLRGLARMGERRWDLVLTNNQRIMLPEERAVAALERLLAIHEARDLLDRDIAAVDLRLPKRPTLRLTTHAVEELRRIRNLAPIGEEDQ